jgi:hypothetical protein
LYAILGEPPVIFSRNFKKENHKPFKKIFSWNDKLVDGVRIIKLNYPQSSTEIDFDLSHKTKFCALVARNKSGTRAGELFSERVRAVRWFEKHAPNDLDLWRELWDDGVVEHFLFFPLKKPAPTNFRGKMGDKTQELKKYKFSIAYENWFNDCGYITEKIFDCFRASNVPVYLGATNIEKYIPKGCFIDRREFKTYEALYNFMKNMDDETYLNYLKNIDAYFKSDLFTRHFSEETFANTIVEGVLS